MLESRLINSVLPPVIVLFNTWFSLCHMLVFNAFLTVHTTFCFFYVYFFYVCVFVFLCVVCCVCQWSLVDWFSNKWMKMNEWLQTRMKSAACWMSAERTSSTSFNISINTGYKSNLEMSGPNISDRRCSDDDSVLRTLHCTQQLTD